MYYTFVPNIYYLKVISQFTLAIYFHLRLGPSSGLLLSQFSNAFLCASPISYVIHLTSDFGSSKRMCVIVLSDICMHDELMGLYEVLNTCLAVSPKLSTREPLDGF